MKGEIKYLQNSIDFVFARRISKKIGENLSGKYSTSIVDAHQTFLDHAEQSTTYAFESSSKDNNSKKQYGNLIGNKIAYKINRKST